jgi:tRNA-specific 2-thiouridylase
MNWIQQPNWSRAESFTIPIMARIRYRQPLQKALFIKKAGNYYLLFEELQRGITPGQFAAWYANEELIGSAVIVS